MTHLQHGSAVYWKEKTWILIDIPEIHRVLLKDPETGSVALAETSELQSFDPANKNKQPRTSLLSIPKEEWQDAWEQYNALRPLLSKAKHERTYTEIDAIADTLGKSRATIYRMLNKIGQDQTVSSLLRKPREDNGVSRLDERIDTVIQEAINTFYLTKERPSVAALHERISLICNDKNLNAPSVATVQRRVARIQDRLHMAKRYSHKKARETFEPLHGSFPGAETPLAVYQIDHSPIDLILVDDQYRQPIGKAYLTIVTDTCTRMLAGFCVSFDPAGALATGLALSHAILPKKMWLTKHEIDTEWPIYGIPQKIFADNAAEFRGTMLERACHEYGIIMENRPKGLPNYGGHVERLFRTFMSRVHTLPGTTFSNVQERGEYESERKSALTLDEFEHWFGIFVTKIYHQRPHKGIDNKPPIKLFEQFILGTETTKGIGLPLPIQDEEKLRLDFLPFVERTIQEYGVLIDNIHYYADVLRSWVHNRDLRNSKLKRKFVFVRDPRDISVVYFLDPEQNQYYRIPYRNLTHPPMSIWELNAVLKNISSREDFMPNEELIFEGLRQMRQIEERAVEKSKAARRSVQRRKNWNANNHTVLQQKLANQKNIQLSQKQGDEIYSSPVGNIQPFNDIEEAE